MKLVLKNQVLKQHIFSGCGSKDSVFQTELLRIGIALYCIISFLILLKDYELFFSPQSLINWEVTNASSYWFELHPSKIAVLLGISQETMIISLIILYMASLTSLLIGVLPTISGFLSLLLFIMFSNLMSPYGYGVDVYLTISLLFVAIFPSGHHYSIIQRNITAELVMLKSISIRTLQVYLALTYLDAGVEKALMPGWWNGEFIFYLINDPTCVSVHIIPDDLPVWVYRSLGISVVLIESLYIVLVWVPFFRTVIVLGILAMHVFIAISMGLTAFGILLLILNIIAWYPSINKDILKLTGHDKKL